MTTRTRTLLPMAACALAGCEWIAGIEDTTVADDAGQTVPADARPDPIDAPRDPRDAAVQDGCPQPCVGDAVAEFAFEQGGPWRYTETVLDADGLPQFRDMVYATWLGLSAWVGETAPLAIAACPSNDDATECLGVEQKLLFAPTSNAPGAPQPALLWSAPQTGSFRLTADWRIADGTATGVPTSVLVARNSLRDSLYTTSFLSSTTPGAFDIEVDAAAGDAIALTVIPGADPGVPLGMSFYVTDLQRNDACQMAYDFGIDGAEGPFDNRCENGDVIAEASAALTQPAAPPPGVPGQARAFSDTTSMQQQGEPNDYDGDWTLQFWATLQGPGDVISDRSCTNLGRPESGGVYITFDGESLFIRIGEEISGTDHCATGTSSGLVTLSPGLDFENAAAWHLYRVVRNKQAGTMTACVDGTYRSSQVLQVPAEATMATDRRLEIGRRADGINSDGSFEGTLADLRFYSRALPCTLRPDP